MVTYTFRTDYHRMVISSLIPADDNDAWPTDRLGLRQVVEAARR